MNWMAQMLKARYLVATEMSIPSPILSPDANVFSAMEQYDVWTAQDPHLKPHR
jgi:hypothetical protein